MPRTVIPAVLVCLLAAGATGCGSSPTPAVARSPSGFMTLRLCLRHHGYAVTPESAAVRRTAPRRFEFVAVWNLVNPNPNLKRIALALTISRSSSGAARAAAWVRRENARVGRGVVNAPVVRFGRFTVLWTATPSRADAHDVYGCVRPAAA